jgi:hypothetical protein
VRLRLNSVIALTVLPSMGRSAVVWREGAVWRGEGGPGRRQQHNRQPVRGRPRSPTPLPGGAVGAAVAICAAAAAASRRYRAWRCLGALIAAERGRWAAWGARQSPCALLHALRELPAAGEGTRLLGRARLGGSGLGEAGRGEWRGRAPEQAGRVHSVAGRLPQAAAAAGGRTALVRCALLRNEPLAPHSARQLPPRPLPRVPRSPTHALGQRPAPPGPRQVAAHCRRRSLNRPRRASPATLPAPGSRACCRHACRRALGRRTGQCRPCAAAAAPSPATSARLFSALQATQPWARAAPKARTSAWR